MSVPPPLSAQSAKVAIISMEASATQLALLGHLHRILLALYVQQTARLVLRFPLALLVLGPNSSHLIPLAWTSALPR